MIYGIVGLGVMGGSYARKLMSLQETVYGFARRKDTIDLAMKSHYISDGTTDFADGLLSRCDIVVLCLYPTLVPKWLEENQQYLKSGCEIMDISGVKTGIIIPAQNAITRNDIELISTHPMCGRESRGIEFSDPNIFNGANYIVVPTEKNSEKAIEDAMRLGRKLGCTNISTLTIDKHDHMIGFLSQLTHVIAVSLMNTHESEELVNFTGDSFRDLTRIASINEDMWTELFLLNKKILLEEIDAFDDALIHFREALETENTDEMKRLFIQSTQRRKKFNR